MSEKFIYRVIFDCYLCKKKKTVNIRYTPFEEKIKEKRVGCRDCGNTESRKGPIMFFFRDLGKKDDDGNGNARVIIERIA